MKDGSFWRRYLKIHRQLYKRGKTQVKTCGYLKNIGRRRLQPAGIKRIYQLRVGRGGAYALAWNTVSAVARSLLLDEDEEFYRKLRNFEMVIIAEINKKGEG